jgi:hypothetical protein
MINLPLGSGRACHPARVEITMVSGTRAKIKISTSKHELLNFRANLNYHIFGIKNKSKIIVFEFFVFFLLKKKML